MKKKLPEKYVLREYPPVYTLEGIIDEFYEFDFKKDEKLNANPYFFPNYTTALLYFTDRISGKSDFYFAGPCKKNVFIPSSCNCYYWAADFHPFIAQSIFKFNILLLVNKVQRAKTLLNSMDYKVLMKSFNDIKSCRGRIKFFEKLVSKKVGYIKKPEKDITAVTDLIVKSGGNVKLEHIYDSIKTSTRQFQRKFFEVTGLTPKEFCRIARIRSAANKLAEGKYGHLDVMFESGYYDQSHFNKEFKELSGSTPSSFQKRYKRIKRTYKGK